MKMTVKAAAALATLIAAAGAAAHPHSAGPRGQVIANEQNHPRFDQNGMSCEWYDPAGPYAIGPAWYGLETAHHGPDAGTRGKGDGCYQTTGGVPPGEDVQNPAIH